MQPVDYDLIVSGFCACGAEVTVRAWTPRQRVWSIALDVLRCLDGLHDMMVDVGEITVDLDFLDMVEHDDECPFMDEDLTSSVDIDDWRICVFYLTSIRSFVPPGPVGMTYQVGMVTIEAGEPRDTNWWSEHQDLVWEGTATETQMAFSSPSDDSLVEAFPRYVNHKAWLEHEQETADQREAENLRWLVPDEEAEDLGLGGTEDFALPA